jgi:hypothetical protein
MDQLRPICAQQRMHALARHSELLKVTFADGLHERHSSNPHVSEHFVFGKPRALLIGDDHDFVASLTQPLDEVRTDYLDPADERPESFNEIEDSQASA